MRALILVLALAGCSWEIESPPPALLDVSPSLVCNDQLTTTVDLAGAGLAPVVVDTLDEGQALQLPELWLARSLELSGQAGDGARVDLDPSEEAARVRWLGQSHMEFDFTPDLAAPEGVYDLWVQNVDARPTAKLHTLAVVPPPTLGDVAPGLVCLEQGDVSLTLPGAGLLDVSDTLPIVDIGELSLPADALDTCYGLAGPTEALSCTELSVTVPEDALGAGVHSLGLTNPYPASCVTPEPVLFEVVDAPSVATAAPDLVCATQEDRTLRLTGTGFLVLADGTVPTVHVGAWSTPLESYGTCTDLEGPSGGSVCTTGQVTLPAGLLPDGVAEVSLTNPAPAGCVATASAALELVPPPDVSLADPALTCLDEGPRSLTLTGTGIVVLADGTLPTVRVGAWSGTPDAATDCVDLLGPAGGQTCSTLALTLPMDAVEPGVVDAVVTNPGDADCVSAAVSLEVVPAPVLADVQPALACDAEGDVTLELTGTGFIVLADGVGPAVSVGTWSGGAAARDCADLTGPAGGQTCATLTVTLPQAALGEGLFDVSVANPDPAGCATDTLTVELIAPPTLSELSTDLTCDAEGDVALTVTGMGFLTAPDGTLPTVHVGGLDLAPTLSGCADLTGPAGGQVCTTADVTVPAGGLGAGVHAVSLTNPAPAACSTAALSLEVVAPPAVVDADPALSCTDAGGDLDLVGSDFLVLGDGTLPTVTVGGQAVTVTASGCAALTGPAGGQVCSSLHATLPPSTLAAGVHDVAVTNPAPAACSGSLAAAVEAVSPPTVTAVLDDLACADAWDLPLQVLGTGFVATADGSLPTVTVGDLDLSVDGIGDCAPLLGPDGGQSCERLDLTVPSGLLAAGVHDVAVHNPLPAACDSSEVVSLELLDAPVLAGVAAELLCTDQASATLALTGAGFAVLDDGTLPSVQVGGLLLPADGATGCASLLGPAGGQECTDITVTVPAGALSDGLHTVEVLNPAPADCAATSSAVVEVVGPPTLASLDPAAQCQGAGDVSVTARGQGFVLLADGTEPTVTVGGELMTVAVSDCDPLTGPAGGQTCRQLDFDVTDGLLGGGAHDVVLTNPGTASCVTTDELTFDVTLPPTLSSIAPTETCSTGSTLQVFGTHFVPTTEVWIDGTVPTVVTYVDETSVYAEVPSGLTEETYHDVTVRNAACGEDTLPGALWVAGVPVVYTVDPSVVWTGTSFQASVFVSGVDAIGDVSIANDAGFSQALTWSWDEVDGHALQAILPSGLTEGSYDLIVASDIGCSATLTDAFYAEDDTTVTVDLPYPRLGWTGEDTAVTVTGAGFVEVPRVYLNPDVTDATTTATLLRSVRFRDDGTLTAVIPAGLDPGLYDVLLINPDGTLGVYEDGFEVTVDPVPCVASAAPASLSTSDGSFTLYGDDFRDPVVTARCVSPGDTTPTSYAGAVTSWTDTSIDATLPAGSMSNGDLCVVIVTNADGTFTEFSAVSITSPALNLFGFTEVAETLREARRAPIAFPGRATDAERYLFVAGGDGGSTATPSDTVERAPLDRFGNLGRFELSDESLLPEPRTLAGRATAGRFVYVVGGHDGVSAVDTVWRAQVLDPLEAPRFDGLSMELADGTDGMSTGTWTYRIAALYPSTWETNPGGESLAGDPIVVHVPDVPELIRLTLMWEPVYGASGYRIYRTPLADDPGGSEEWVVDVPASELDWTDTELATDPSGVPLPDGTLGQWAALPSLGIEREAPAVGIATDPVDPSVRYLYAAGGRDAAGVVLDTIEVLDLTDVDAQVQTAGAWTTLSAVLQDPVHQPAMWVADSSLNPSVAAGDTWVYVGGGKLASGSTTNHVSAGLVLTGGDLGSWSVQDRMNKRRAGLGMAAASDQLYAFGGHNGSPNSTGDSTALDVPPALTGWNAGIGIEVPRYLMGFAQESANIYLVGGETTLPASDSVEHGPW